MRAVQLVRDGLLFGASAAAGAVNAIAGGGTLLSFPAAIAWGLPSPVANATNALAMSPGAAASAWAFRRELGARASTAGLLAVPTIVGAALGAALMRLTPARLFDAIVPVLVFAATLALLLQGLVSRRAEAAGTPTRTRLAAVVGAQLLVGVYGGYFGAAMGIVMLALLSALPGTIRDRVGLKNLVSALANGVAAIYFIGAGLVDARAALIMVPGAIVGGFAGGLATRRASARVVRAVVVAIGLGVSALLAYRAVTSGRL